MKCDRPYPGPFHLKFRRPVEFWCADKIPDERNIEIQPNQGGHPDFRRPFSSVVYPFCTTFGTQDL